MGWSWCFWVVLGAVWEVSWSVEQNTNRRRISHMEALLLKRGCKYSFFVLQKPTNTVQKSLVNAYFMHIGFGRLMKVLILKITLIHCSGGLIALQLTISLSSPPPNFCVPIWDALCCTKLVHSAVKLMHSTTKLMHCAGQCSGCPAHYMQSTPGFAQEKRAVVITVLRGISRPILSRTNSRKFLKPIRCSCSNHIIR